MFGSYLKSIKYTYKSYFLPQHSSIKIYQFVPQHFKMPYSICWLIPSAVCLHVITIICTCKRCTVVHCPKPVNGAIMFTVCGTI